MDPSVPLQGLTIAVTRPADNNSGISTTLRLAGAEVVCFPTLAIRAIEPGNNLLANIRACGPYDILVFISRNAVRYGLPIVVREGFADNAIIAAIGPATRAELSVAGIENCMMGPAPHDSEALLTVLPLQELKAKSVLIIKGCGGRNQLSTEIQQRGTRAQELDVYQRILPKIDKPMVDPVARADYILFTSSESANNLFKLLPKSLVPAILESVPVVGHERIAATIRRLGFKKSPIIATSPSDNAMFDALVQYVKNGDHE